MHKHGIIQHLSDPVTPTCTFIDFNIRLIISLCLHIYIFFLVLKRLRERERGRVRLTVVATVPAACGMMMGLEHRHSGMEKFL